MTPETLVHFSFSSQKLAQSVYKRQKLGVESAVIRTSASPNNVFIKPLYDHAKWLQELHVDLLPIGELPEARVLIVSREGTVIHAAMVEHIEDMDHTMDSPPRWLPAQPPTPTVPTKLTEKEELVE